MTPLKEIIAEMRAEKTRLLLTILAVAWATFSISLMLAVGEGLRTSFGSATQGAGNNVVFASPGQTTTAYQGNALNLPVTISPSEYANLSKATPGIKHISPQYSFSAALQYQHHTNPASLYAVDPNFGAMRNIVAQAGGRFIDDLDQQLARKVIVLGNSVADTLFGPNNSPVGKTIYVANEPFLVIGVMQKKFSLAGPPDDYSAWIPSATYVALNHPSKINLLVFTPQNLSQLTNIENALRKTIATTHHLDPNDSNILQFHDYQDLQRQTSQIFGGLEIFLGLIGGLTLLVAGVGIANVMFVSVKRATKEIGIKMAIGARAHQILSHYILESLITTVIGGTIGIIITEIIIWLISQIHVQSKFFLNIQKPVPILSTLVLMIVISVLGLVGFLAGYFPARNAASIDPAVALRHE